MNEALDLNDQQQAKVSELNLEFSKRQQTLFEADGSLFGKRGETKKTGKRKKRPFKLCSMRGR